MPGTAYKRFAAPDARVGVGSENYGLGNKQGKYLNDDLEQDLQVCHWVV